MENLAAHAVLRLAPIPSRRCPPLAAPCAADVALAVPGGWLLRRGDRWSGWRHGVSRSLAVRGRQDRVDLDREGRALLVSEDREVVVVDVASDPPTEPLARVDAAVGAAAWLREGLALFDPDRVTLTRWLDGALVAVGAFALPGVVEATTVLDGRVLVARGEGSTSFVSVYPEVEARLLGRFAGEVSRWSTGGGAQWASRDDRLWLDGRAVRCGHLPRAYEERRGALLPEVVEVPLLSPPPAARGVHESGVQPIPWR